MPEINIRVKIIGGKRTDTYVYVQSMAVNSKSIVFKNGAKLSDSQFEAVVDKAIIDYIDESQPQTRLKINSPSSLQHEKDGVVKN